MWFNTTHMHFRTHVKHESRGQAGRWQSEYHDTMIDHDELVGDLLALLDELGIAEDTIVMYSTDNGPHMNTWPDAGMTPFRSEKNSNWEGAYRVPAMVRWPGRIAAGTVLNGIVSHNDWFPTLLAAAGVPDIADELKAGTDLDGTTLQGAPRRPQPARLPHRGDAGRARVSTSSTSPTTATSPRCGSTTGSWSSSSSVRRARCRSGPSRSPELRVPKIFNLRTDPYERADITSNTYYDWMLDHAWVCGPDAGVRRRRCSRRFAEFPPRQKPASFSLDQVLAKLQTGVHST